MIGFIRSIIDYYKSLFFPLEISKKSYNYYSMFGWFKKTKKQLDPQPTYIRVQFMTAEEKGQKDKKIAALKELYKNDF